MHGSTVSKWARSNKIRYQINPDDTEITIFCKERLKQCIKGVSGTSVALDSRSGISQLTNWFSQTRTLSKAVCCTTTKKNHTDQHTPMYKDQGTGGNCSSPCCTPFLEHTFTGASVRCNTTSTYTGLWGSSNKTTMASMWDSTPHMQHYTSHIWKMKSIKPWQY